MEQSIKKSITINSALLLKTDDVVDDDRLNLVLSRLDALRFGHDEKKQHPVEILLRQESVALRSPSVGDRALININFHEGAANHRRLYGGGRSQQLSKAIGLDQKKNLTVVDATAGLAGDSFVMASLGASVQMLERSPVLSLMIEDALLFARRFDSENLELMDILNRMRLTTTNAFDWLSVQEDRSCDVIYLDPMFPERKKKAAVKKEMQVLHHLLGVAEKDEQERLAEERELLSVALSKALHRVVVKRPRYASPLPDSKPTYSLEGKSTRFDIYALSKIC